MIGVLPGSDKQLGSEIVLLSAHYDHLGKVKGRIHPGAADNASGVAALLATAKELSRHRPKRTVAFAAFDCEEKMLLGSFAFSCRTDVVQAKIVGVVNVDMLGREFLDSVRETLFISGTERYPSIREEILRFGTNAHIRILPLGSDLVGPRSDHVAFESKGIPCLFFSCGTGVDYHAATDTPNTLDYSAIERSTQVILQTVAELAEMERHPVASKDAFDGEELRTVKTVLGEVIADYEKSAHSPKTIGDFRRLVRTVPISGPKPPDLAGFRALSEEAEGLRQKGGYSQGARERLVIDATGILAPYLLPVAERSKGSAEEKKNQMLLMQCLQSLYLNYGQEIMEGYREFVSQLLKYRPSPFRTMPKFKHEIYEIADRDIQFTQTENGKWRLNALANECTFRAGSRTLIWPLKSFGAHISAGSSSIDCEGTKEQIADFCLLNLRAERNNEVRSKQLRRLLDVVTGEHLNCDYRLLLKARLALGNFTDEPSWIAHCVESGSPELAMEAIKVAKGANDDRIRIAIDRIIVDRTVRSDVRAAAIKSAAKTSKSALQAVCDDKTMAYKLEYTPRLRPGYPFADRTAVRLFQPILEKEMRSWPDSSKTIGDSAKGQLRKIDRQPQAKRGA
ncbi:MAG: Aminopeptidase [Verrucomicrobiales bacterium]|nr:Aminopeptidase [Verrucomicrobiales bacterium]